MVRWTAKTPQMEHQLSTNEPIVMPNQSKLEAFAKRLFHLERPTKRTLTNVTRSSRVSTTSVMARYWRTFSQIRMIFRTSDSSKDKRRAEVPWRIPAKTIESHQYCSSCVPNKWSVVKANQYYEEQTQQILPRNGNLNAESESNTTFSNLGILENAKYTKICISWWSFFDIRNSRNAQASLGTLTDASVVMVAHWLLSSVLLSNDHNDWPVHSLKHVPPWSQYSNNKSYAKFVMRRKFNEKWYK